MTRIAGTNIIKAPCCGAFFSTVSFASINFMASEHWTDGATENSLSQSDGGLRRCTCGGYFLSGYAERVGFIPKNIRQQQEQYEYELNQQAEKEKQQEEKLRHLEEELKQIKEHQLNHTNTTNTTAHQLENNVSQCQNTDSFTPLEI